MAQKRRKFTRELKLQVVREGESVKPVAQVAREHEIHLKHIIKWRQLHQQHAEQAFGANGHAEVHNGRIRTHGGATDDGERVVKKALLRLEGSGEAQR